MSNNAVALVVAIVGVVGGLTAAVLTQLLIMRAQRAQRREESWRTTLKDRRDNCVALSVEARRFQQRLISCLSEGQENKSAELEQDWQTFIDRYTEVRIVLPQDVVDAAAEVFGKLGYVYERVGTSPSADERKKLRDFIEDGKGMDAIRQLRKASRKALGSDLPLRPPKGL